MPIRRW